MLLSLIIPCFNEQEVLEQLYSRVDTVLQTLDGDYEVILVDDGSRDDTLKILRSIHTRNNNWKVISFSRNFGHQTAVSAGMFHARGDAVMIIDADLQDPPELIPKFIAKWREGFEVVYAVRKNRKEGFIKRFCYTTFYRILAHIASIRIPLDSGDFCLMDKKVVSLINSMPESNRFIRGLRAWSGFRQAGLEYDRDARAAGIPQYNFRKLLQLAFDGIFSFSTAPLRMTTYFGFFISIMAFLAALFYFIQRIFSDYFTRFHMGLVPGFATTIIAVFFLGGVQLICLGVIGEYIGRIYDEVKRRPLWITKETLGITTDKACLQEM